MRIGIDGRVLDKKITGTGRYLINILNELPNVDKKNEYILFTNNPIEFDKSYFEIVNYKKLSLPNKLYSPLWINYKIPKLVKKHNVDLLFMPNVFAPFVSLGKTKVVSVVHDAIYKIYKEYYPLSWRIYKSLMLPGSVKNSDIVVTVSEQSKQDLIKYENVPEEKIRIVYNTASENFKSLEKSEKDFEEMRKELELPEKYLLFVGMIEKRKNIFGCLKIIDNLQKHGSDLKLVLVGKPGYDSQNILPEVEKRKDYVKHISFVDDKYLVKLYNYAFAFLFPSFYEGFGIPPLEAMQCGIPVLSSNTSALKEVIGDGGILHSPDDHEGFAVSILNLEKDKTVCDEFRFRGLKQAEKFHINKVVRTLVNVFDELS